MIYYQKNNEEILKETNEDTKREKSIDELKQYGKEVEVGEVKKKGEKNYFYVTIDQNVYEVSLDGTKYIGEQSDEKVEIQEGDIQFSYSPIGWTNGTVKVKIEGNENLENKGVHYDLVYQQEGKNIWTSYTKEIEVTQNQTIYAKLQNILGETTVASFNVTNIDQLAPKDFIPTANSTTNSIQVIAKVEDAEATKENGKSGIKEYRFSKDNGVTWTESQKEKEYTFKNLIQNIDYHIQVEVKDYAGNTKIGKITKTTGEVEGLTPGNTIFTYNPSGWTNANVTATVSTTVTGYTLQTSKNGKTWTNTNTQTFSANGTVYARLWDGTNYGGASSGNVTNIDKTKPVVTGATSTTNSVKITATDEASGIIGYTVTTNTTTPTSFTSCTSTKSLNVTVTGKTQGTTYYVWVKDAAGNISSSKSTATGIVPVPATTFSYSPSGWTNGNVVATASTTTGGYTLQTSQNGSNWSNTASQTFTANGTMYVRLWDGTNASGYVTGNVTNIDKTAPTAPLIGTQSENITAQNCSFQIVLKSGGTDNIGIQKYQYSLNGGNTYLDWNSSVIHYFGSTENYNVCMRSVDHAGNVSTASNTIIMNPKRIYIKQLYTYILGRPASESETAGWESHGQNGAQTASGIIGSEESTNRFNIVGSTTYANGMYLGILGRGADPGGLNLHVSLLNSSGIQSAVKSLVNSAEAQGIYSKWNIGTGNI